MLIIFCTFILGQLYYTAFGRRVPSASQHSPQDQPHIGRTPTQWTSGPPVTTEICIKQNKRQVCRYIHIQYVW